MNAFRILRQTAACAVTALLAGTAALAAAPGAPIAFHAEDFLMKNLPVSHALAFDWKPDLAGDAAQGYRIYVGGVNDNNFSLYADVAGGDVYHHRDLNPAILTTGHQYAFYITAYNVDGESGPSQKSYVDFEDPQVPPQEKPIVFTSVWVHKLAAGSPFKHDVDATTNQSGAVQYSLVNAPEGMTIDPATGVVVWASVPSEVGEYKFVVRAAVEVNGAMYEGVQENVIHVVDWQEPPASLLTFVDPYSMFKLFSGEEFAFDCEVKTTVAGDISFELQGAPEGMTINPVTGYIKWVAAAAGDYKFMVRAELRGAETLEATMIIVLTVIGDDEPEVPVGRLLFTSHPPVQVAMGEEYVYTPVLEWDTEGEIRFELSGNTANVQFDTATGTVRWTPTGSDVQQKFYLYAVLHVNGKYIAEAQQAWSVEVTAEAEGVITGADEKLPVTAVEVYPNPVAHQLSVHFDDLPGRADVVLYNIAGVPVAKVSTNDTGTELDIRSLPHGTYYLHVASGGKTRVVPVHITR